MSRQRLKDKKVKKLCKETGLEIVHAFVRGGCDHAITLYLSDGTVAFLLKDGTLKENGDIWKWNTKNNSIETEI